MREAFENILPLTSCSGEPSPKIKGGGQECPPHTGKLVIYFADPTSADPTSADPW